MFNSVRKDKNRRTLVKKFEIKRLQNKVFLQDLSLKKNSIVKNSKRINLYFFLREKAMKPIPRNSSKSRVQNRCIESGRSRAVLRFCKLSRICLRDKASKGSIPGISKASW